MGTAAAAAAMSFDLLPAGLGRSGARILQIYAAEPD
jgi:hypothetical protein